MHNSHVLTIRKRDKSGLVTIRWYKDRIGREVRLTDAAWHDHILARHDYMLGQEDAIGASLGHPDVVTCHQTKPGRKLYYRFNGLQPPANDYLKVVVDYRQDQYGENVGYVVTAFAVGSIGGEETVEWQPNHKPTPS